MKKVNSSSFKHRVRVAKRLLASRGCEIIKKDNILEVNFPSRIKYRENSVVQVDTGQGLINLALQVLRAEKATRMTFKS